MQRRLQAVARAAAVGLLWPAAARAQAPGASSPSSAALPPIVHVAPVPCGSGLLDVAAFAAALRVELTQAGVRAVDVVGPGAPASDSAAWVELGATPCSAAARAVTFAIRGPWPAGPTGTIALGDVDYAARPRVAALAVAEAFRVTVAENDAPPTAREGSPPELGMPPGPPSSDARAPAPPAPPPRSHGSPAASQAAPSPAPESTSAPGRALVAATLDVRDFTAFATGLLGPRVEVAASLGSAPLRFHADAGAAFGSAHDPLGSVQLTLVSGAAGLALLGRAGALSVEIGPRLEAGWIEARGSPISASAGGGRLDSAFMAASLFAGLGIAWSPHWVGVLAVDVGDAFVGLEARSDNRPTAGTTGPMLGARVGFSYGW